MATPDLLHFMRRGLHETLSYRTKDELTRTLLTDLQTLDFVSKGGARTSAKLHKAVDHPHGVVYVYRETGF